MIHSDQGDSYKPVRQMEMRRFGLRYGVFIVLVLMFTGTLYMLDHLSIRCKVSADLLDVDGRYTAYVGKSEGYVPSLGQAFELECGERGRLLFSISDIVEEPVFWHLYLDPVTPVPELTASLAGNTKITGYVFTHRVKLRELVFRKLK